MKKIQIAQDDLFFPDGVVIIDKNKNIVAFNEAASRITGYNEHEVSLQDYGCLFKSSKTEKQYIDESLLKGKYYSNITINITRSDKRTVNVFASITPIKKSNNENNYANQKHWS